MNTIPPAPRAAAARGAVVALELAAWWRPIPGVGLGIARAADPAAMHPAEDALAATLPAARRADFLLGRTAAHRAIAAAGLPPVAVLWHGTRPVAAGATLSISHSCGVAVALAGPATFAGLGVDVELSLLPAGAAHLVAGPAERRLIGDSGGRLTALFSAKEAAYKAFCAVGARPGRLRDIRLRPGAGGYWAVGGGRRAAGAFVRSRTLSAGVLSWTLLRAGH